MVSCTWSRIVSKIDVRSGMSGPTGQMNPKQEKPDRNRGVALWNNLVISVTGYAAVPSPTRKPAGSFGQSEIGSLAASRHALGRNPGREFGR
jgi:hypothetical protein